MHEWTYEGEFSPKLSVEDNGLKETTEPIENVITWIFEENSFVPCGKIVGADKYSIVSDYIGRPTQCYNDVGILVWETEYDIYGKLRNLKGDRSLIHFRQLGQYEDVELGGLYYNRFRYFNSVAGIYTQQDPLMIDGGMNVYAYIHDPNLWVDVFGLIGGMNGATVTVTATSKKGISSVTRSSGKGLHAEINALQELRKMKALNGADVVISDVTGHFPGGVAKDVQVFAKCRHDIFQELIDGKANSITIPGKGGAPITIMKDQFKAAQKATGSVSEQFEGTKLYKKCSDASFDALNKHHH